ncbi:chemotaxis protein CheD [Pseudomonas oryzihabitans]|uniref:Probable chemoreceptor glutamine deamidase CheD n=1 Tax=Pseudomonas oryzihabitans TaxID=47885 RepID=A0A178LJU3_9PSED|nr:chemotaxis protein CheD [Pseudomonas oryzihabitans]
MAVGERFLTPGDWYFGRGDLQLRTVLGSCVSFVFWHPGDRLGGMTHSLLPSRLGGAKTTRRDGHYIDDALYLSLRAMARHGSDPRGYRIHLYGGGSMFPGVPSTPAASIGQRNVEAARALLAAYGLRCDKTHVEGIGHRKLILDLRTGAVSLQQATLSANSSSPDYP